MLLDTCGQYFVSGSSKKKLDYFLLYFQRYFLFKKHCYPSAETFPLGVSQLVVDSVAALRPKLEMFDDFEEAAGAVLKVEEELLAVLRERVPGYLAQASQGAGQAGQQGAGLGRSIFKGFL